MQISRIVCFSFQVCNALKVDYYQNDHLDLGDLSAACLTDPSSCSSNGGSLAFWIKYEHSYAYARVIWTSPRPDAGFEIGLNYGNLL